MGNHDYFLNQLILNLDKIDEDIYATQWIMKEGILQHNNSKSQMKLCDLLIGFYDGSGLCIELKGSRSKKDKAKLQLASGYELMTTSMNYDNVRKKVVYYTDAMYSYENIK